MNTTAIIALVIFSASMVVIITEKVHKASAALLGAMLMVLLGVQTQHQAFEGVDWNVIFLLLGMMIITNITKRTGLFQYLAIRIAKAARGEPLAIMIILSFATALISGVLDNVTTVLILVPITLLIAVELGVSPTPFVIALALASNVGGTATLIGDPPNIMIGSAAGLGFSDFLLNTAPVAVISLGVLALFLFVLFRKSLVVPNERKARIMAFDESKAIEDRPLLVKSLVVLTAVVLAFVLHGVFDLEPATVALSGAALLLVISGIKEIDDIFGEVEWTTMVFFVGLFMVVGGLVESGIMEKLSRAMLSATEGRMELTRIVILWASGILSGIVDNVPFVATMIPLIQDLETGLGAGAVEPLWWALSLGACLGGNATLVGASANVVSAGIAKKNGFPISFMEFTRYGLVYTALTLVVSTVYLLIRY